jgi:hypothetical protein
MVVKGKNRDTAWYAITDAEWPRIKVGMQRWLDADNFDLAGGQKRGLQELIAQARPG